MNGTCFFLSLGLIVVSFSSSRAETSSNTSGGQKVVLRADNQDYIKITFEARGRLAVKESIVTDRKTVESNFHQDTGASLMVHGVSTWQLFLGSKKSLPSLAKEFDGKSVIVTGTVIFVPWTGISGLPQPPKMVIIVSDLKAAEK